MYHILHIFLDEKFFDNVASFFDAIPNIKNHYYFYTSSKNYRFRYIRDYHKVQLVFNKKEYNKILGSGNYDIVYLHSLAPMYYDYVLRINKKAKVIWWAWGYDLYSPMRACSPLLNIDLYKSETNKYIRSQNHNFNLISIIRRIYHRITYLSDYIKRRRVVSRMDYFSPVLSLEYYIMRDNCKYFRAKPFMLQCGPGVAKQYDLKYFTSPGNILVGNSLTFTNNHLDIFNSIASCHRTKSQQFIVPINYGCDLDKVYIKSRFDVPNVLWLEDFMPKDEYFAMFDTITHAVFGTMRQQAMGNIFYCLGHGVKVYLYADSIIYKHLLSQGYIVYKVEDITDDSFLYPLDYDASITNCKLVNEMHSDSINYAYKEIMKLMDSALTN